ncbi:MAG: hypothetical protein Fur0037_04240 [Planctomycetota bacterium]
MRSPRSSEALALLLAALISAAAASAQDAPDEFELLEPVLQAAVARAAPSVVAVETFGGTRRALTGDGPSPGGQTPAPPPGKRLPPRKPRLETPGFHQTRGRTTGVVLTEDGWILVSRFSLNFDPTTILVTLADGATYHATRAGEDTSRGIALVKIGAKGLPVPEFVDPDEVRVGQWAFALGRTFGIGEPTVNIGIVSAKRRQFGRALQIDAYTSPSNYGGAVVDVRGRVLGVAVPLSPSGRDAGVEWYDSGIGFAATIADIGGLLERMKRGEVLHRGWLGIAMEPSFLGPGAKLQNVPRGSVADKAGLRRGDVVVAVDGTKVRNSFHLQVMVSSRMGGDPVTLDVERRRGLGRVSMTVILAETPIEEQKPREEPDTPATFPLPEGK